MNQGTPLVSTLWESHKETQPGNSSHKYIGDSAGELNSQGIQPGTPQYIYSEIQPGNSTREFNHSCLSGRSTENKQDTKLQSNKEYLKGFERNKEVH